MKLGDTYSSGEASHEVAAQRHASWASAVAGYLARRRRELLQGISEKASFDAEKVRHRLKVLLEVGQTLCAELQSIDPGAEDAIERAPSMTREDHQIALAYLLTPLGWREKHLPALERRRKLALVEWEEDKDGDRNLALASEIDKLITFLQAVESDARLVTAQQNRSTLVGRRPLIPGEAARQIM